MPITLNIAFGWLSYEVSDLGWRSYLSTNKCPSICRFLNSTKDQPEFLNSQIMNQERRRENINQLWWDPKNPPKPSLQGRCDNSDISIAAAVDKIPTSCVCVLCVRFCSPFGIQRAQCPSLFFILLYHINKLCGHETTTQDKWSTLVVHCFGNSTFQFYNILIVTLVITLYMLRSTDSAAFRSKRWLMSRLSGHRQVQCVCVLHIKPFFLPVDSTVVQLQ